MFYHDRQIEFYECRKAQYKGKIIQHTDCSYSGYVLEKNPDRISRLFSSTKCDTIITFKNIEQEFNTKYHFGNVEGLNSLSGRNLSVIGLPNKPDFVYCLYGMRAGLELNQTQNMHHQRIEWNGYSFSLNTFKDETLQKNSNLDAVIATGTGSRACKIIEKRLHCHCLCRFSSRTG